jgi:ABC-type transporter Mla subunit MlaD
LTGRLAEAFNGLVPDDTGPEITLGTLHGDLGTLSGDLSRLSGDLSRLRGDVGRLSETLGEVKMDVRDVKTDVRDVRTDVRDVKADVRDVKTDVRELKLMVANGFRAFPPDWPAEMLRLLRENNRLTDARFAQLDATLREQAVETHTVLRAFANGQGELVAELRALIVRVDALIRGRRDGRSG